MFRFAGCDPAEGTAAIQRYNYTGADRLSIRRITDIGAEGLIPEQTLGQLKILLREMVAEALPRFRALQALIYLGHVLRQRRPVAGGGRFLIFARISVLAWSIS